MRRFSIHPNAFEKLEGKREEKQETTTREVGLLGSLGSSRE
jgi:hypothetical protein